MLGAMREYPDDAARAESMAEAIIKITEEKGSCLPHELIEQGFTYAEINRLWDAAKAMADFETRISKR